MKNLFNEESLFYKYSRAIIVISYIVYYMRLGVEFKMYIILYPAILIGIIDGLLIIFQVITKKAKRHLV